jgi:hypothetical protein
MNNIIIKNKISNGEITYNVGDEVVVFRRKPNGHPRALKDGIPYVIKKIDLDGHLMVSQRSSDGIGFLQQVRVHKMYMMSISVLREIKLNSIL